MTLLEGKRILVVEDETLVAMVVEDMLTDLGAVCVGIASTVSEALQRIDGETIDAVVLDVNLKGEKSTPIADRLRALTIPFILATGFDASNGLGQGAAAILTKPFGQDGLAKALNRLFSA